MRSPAAEKADERRAAPITERRHLPAGSLDYAADDCEAAAGPAVGANPPFSTRS
ncbi:MAG: hypothetical protein ACRD26_19475 [Vicinamibacterales bacterium]